ncbi:Uncharacterised protein [uncultured archaeon]|nr:Uncharacterised protein [uncultured archaeon]
MRSNKSAFIPAEILRFSRPKPNGSRLCAHVCPQAYVYTPSRGVTLEARDSGRLYLRFLQENLRTLFPGFSLILIIEYFIMPLKTIPVF